MVSLRVLVNHVDQADEDTRYHRPDKPADDAFQGHAARRVLVFRCTSFRHSTNLRFISTNLADLRYQSGTLPLDKAVMTSAWPRM
jgi:hypothetical protein